MALPKDGRKYELLGGELLVSPTGFRHGYISTRLLSALMEHALKNRLGVAVDSGTGFRMASGDCLSPDASFIQKGRIPHEEAQSKFYQGGPDLAVEVISAGERRKPLKRKVGQYFANGTKLAWLVNPRDRTVAVCSSVDSCEILRDGDHLDGGTVLPGFTFPVSQLFDIPDFSP